MFKLTFQSAFLSARGAPLLSWRFGAHPPKRLPLALPRSRRLKAVARSAMLAVALADAGRRRLRRRNWRDGHRGVRPSRLGAALDLTPVDVDNGRGGIPVPDFALPADLLEPVSARSQVDQD